MSDQAKIDFSQRQPLPDLIRAWALMGIVVVNVGLFAWPGEQGYTAISTTVLDDTVNLLMTALFMTKSYALFSLMFGVGLAFQIISAKQRGKSPANRHFRRMFGLFVLGWLHFVFFFIGDILIMYSILGCLLYAFRSVKPRTLIKTGIILIVVQVAIMLLLAGLFALIEVIPESPDQPDIFADMKASIETNILVFGDGTFMEAAKHRLGMGGETIIGGTLAQGWSVFGFFLIGLALAKLGLINRPDDAFWRKCRLQAFPIGLIGSFFAAYIFIQTDSMLDVNTYLSLALLTFFSPFLAFGYAGWIAKYAAGPTSKLKAFIARSGSATLSAYLLQSLILSFIFAAYGYGYYAKLGPAHTIAIGAATGLFTLVFIGLWRNIFARGPFEMLLRRWTYLGGR